MMPELLPLKKLAMAAPAGVTVMSVGAGLLLAVADNVPHTPHSDVILVLGVGFIVTVAFEVSLALRFKRQEKTLEDDRAALLSVHKDEYSRALAVADGFAASLDTHSARMQEVLDELHVTRDESARMQAQLEDIERRVKSIEDRWMGAALRPPGSR
jgi:type VI protein secretion system component VasK